MLKVFEGESLKLEFGWDLCLRSSRSLPSRKTHR